MHDFYIGDEGDEMIPNIEILLSCLGLIFKLILLDK